MSYLSGCPARPTLLPANVVQLRAAAPSALFVDAMEAVLPGAASVYRWDPASTTADDGSLVIKPNDVAPADPGRWLIVTPPGITAEPYSFCIAGVYSAAAVPAYFDPPMLVIPPAAPRTLFRVWMIRRTAGLAGSTTIQLYRNGNPILVTPLSIAAASGDNAGAQTVIFNPGEDVFAATDIIECELQAVESYKAGPPPGPEGLRVLLQF